MGKKTRKTRWRTLTIADDHSDSEESNTAAAPRLPKAYQNKSHFNKHPYSSQSTPRRRYYQHDGAKSTRSSSTASENKITFNEDEYTRITTPRQDVLFKKGYLSKPKNYQTQNSTGTSITSAGNSTGNGTPDHQSTDLDYDSQFVFPNGFVDHNGIYYVNSYEPYPLVLYNPQNYYPDYNDHKTKRYSTGSLTESMSPNNEEATSQDLSGGEASNNVSDYSGHHQVYNMVYPGYYVNSVCPSNDVMDDESSQDQGRRIKKRRRRKTQSQSHSAQDSSEYTEDESDSCREDPKPQIFARECEPTATEDQSHLVETPNSEQSIVIDAKTEDDQVSRLEKNEDSTEAPGISKNEEKNVGEAEDVNLSCPKEVSEESKLKTEENSTEILEKFEEVSEECKTEVDSKPVLESSLSANRSEDLPKVQKYSLKPDAEEFIPRAYRNPELNFQFIKVPPNFLPIPVMPLQDYNGQTFNPAFLPPGIPFNFLPHDPKLFPNFMGFAPPMIPKGLGYETDEKPSTIPLEPCDSQSTAKEGSTEPSGVENPQQTVENPKEESQSIDLSRIVSKLEEAKKTQDKQTTPLKETVPVCTVKHDKNEFRANSGNFKYRSGQNLKRNNHFVNSQTSGVSVRNSPSRSLPQQKFVQNSPQRLRYQNNINEDSIVKREEKDGAIEEKPKENSFESKQNAKPRDIYQKSNPKDQQSDSRRSPGKFQKNWKSTQNGNKSSNSYKTETKDFKPRLNSRSYSEHEVKDSGCSNQDRNYSETLKNHHDSPRNSNVIVSRSTTDSNRVHNGATKTLTESNRVQTEFYRIPAESNKILSEPAKIPAESNRIQTNSISKMLERASGAVPKENQLYKESESCSPKKEFNSPLKNQWISVSSRKKRKNRYLEGTDALFDDHFEGDVDVEEQSQKDLFESYDVTMLVDVKKEELNLKVEDNVQTQSKGNVSVEKNVSIRSVDEIEKELIVINESKAKISKKESSNIEKESKAADASVSHNEKNEEKSVETVILPCLLSEKDKSEVSHPKINSTKTHKEVAVNTIEVNTAETAGKTFQTETKISEEQSKSRSKKKSKKNTQKPLTKRIIITDDLSMVKEEIKTPIKKVVKRMDEKPEKTPNSGEYFKDFKEASNVSMESLMESLPLKDAKEVNGLKEEGKLDENSKTANFGTDSQPSKSEGKDAKVDSAIAEKEPSKTNQSEDKKSRKKKKKQTKNLTSSLSSSSATLNLVDDSYDFLLESALDDDSPAKTNVEVSEELDRMIQKAQYSSLEGKIRSLNADVDSNDDFFKSIFGSSSSLASSSDKHRRDFSKMTIGPMATVSADDHLNVANVETLTASDLDAGPLRRKQYLKDLHDDRDCRDGADPTHRLSTTDETKSLYPITEAVKEWMCKTRETTPDVDILKSPSEILREFSLGDALSSDSDSFSDDQTVKESLAESDNLEVTLFVNKTGSGRVVFESGDKESRESSIDILDYWDEDVEAANCAKSEVRDVIVASADLKSKVGAVVEQAEDAVEVYESKYGKNEDYLIIKKETEEKVRLNYPKHGNLPYRAICCSIQ